MNIKILCAVLLIVTGLANAAEERTVVFSGTVAEKYKNEEQPVQVFTCDNYQQTPTFSLCWNGSTSPNCVNTTEINENPKVKNYQKQTKRNRAQQQSIAKRAYKCRQINDEAIEQDKTRPTP